MDLCLGQEWKYDQEKIGNMLGQEWNYVQDKNKFIFWIRMELSLGQEWKDV